MSQNADTGDKALDTRYESRILRLIYMHPFHKRGMRWHARALLCALVLRVAVGQDCSTNEYMYYDSCRTCLQEPQSYTTNYCICNAGYFLNFEQDESHHYILRCTACEQGKYLEESATVQTACNNCPVGTYWSDSGESGIGECVECEAGKYNFRWDLTDCYSCSDIGQSPGNNYCICNAGYYFDRSYRCKPCDRGTYLPFQNIVQTTCYSCGTNTYSANNGASACSVCPEHSASLPSSTSADACLCNAGYAQNASTLLCSACQPGTYAAAAGSNTCVLCPADTYSTQIAAASNTTCTPCPADSEAATGSKSFGECTCLAGYGYASGTCTLCEAGKHTPGGANQACEPCEDLDGYVLDIGWVQYDGVSCDANPRTCCASSALISNKRIYDFDELDATSDDCASECKTQNAGYMEVYYSSASFVYCRCYSSCIATDDCTPPCTMVQRHISALANASMADCVACNAGTRAVYADDTAEYKTCVACAVNETTVISTNGQIVCECVPGYGRADADADADATAQCLQCTPGTYSNGSCVACPAGTYSTATAATALDTCTACGAHETSVRGSESPDACVCEAGYATDGSDTCEACALGKYAPMDGTPSCLWCPDATFASSTAQTRCDACPANATSDLYGDQSVLFREGCFCNAGFAAAADGNCTLCAAGTYKTEAKNTDCVQCDANTYSVSVGAIDASACLACPAGSTAPAGSDAVSDCACVAGDFFDAAANACTRCPAHSTSAANSMLASNCTCEPGYTRGGSEQCEGCAPSTYKHAQGDHNCTACSGGSYSIVTAATTPETCLVDYDPARTCYRSHDSVAYTDVRISKVYENHGVYVLPSGFSCHDLNLGSNEPCLRIFDTLYKFSSYNSTEKDAIALALCSACTCACSVANDVPWPLGLPTCEALFLQYLPQHACPAGQHRPPGSTNASCTLCPLGKYQDTIGQTFCIPCPGNSYTSSTGSVKRVDCVCNAGYGREDDACTPCAPGTVAGQEMPVYTLVGAGTCQAPPDEVSSYVQHIHSTVAFASDATCRDHCTREHLWPENEHCIGYAYMPSERRCYLYFSTPVTLHDIHWTNWTGFFGEENSRHPWPSIHSGESLDLSATDGRCWRKSLGCQACAQGKAQPLSAQTTCHTCTAGTYQPAFGQTECAGCPHQATSLTTGARSVVDCVCLPGHGQTAQNYTAGCAPCAAGSAEPGGLAPFTLVGTGACAVCALERLETSESECALACATYASCSGYTFGPFPGTTASACRLHFDAWPGSLLGWAPVPDGRACAPVVDVVAGAYALDARVCRRKAEAHAVATYRGVLEAHEFEDLGVGVCQGPLAEDVPNHVIGYNLHFEFCRAACLNTEACTGFAHGLNYLMLPVCLMYFADYFDTDLGIFLSTPKRAYKGTIEKADVFSTDYTCHRKAQRIVPLGCPACARGSVQPDAGSVACVACGAALYQDARGQETCASCPTNQTFAYPYAHATSDLGCVCASGYFGAPATACTQCRGSVYSELPEHTYDQRKTGLCDDVNGPMLTVLNARVGLGFNDDKCKAECTSHPSCTGYAHARYAAANWVCAVYGAHLDAGLPRWSTVANPQQLTWYAREGAETTITAEVLNTTLDGKCYARTLGARVCKDCPANGRVVGPVPSLDACVLEYNFDAPLTGQAWLDAAANMTHFSHALEAHNVLADGKESLRAAPAAWLNVSVTVPQEYTCCNITAGAGAIEGAPAITPVFFVVGGTVHANFTPPEPYAQARVVVCGLQQGTVLTVATHNATLHARINVVFYRPGGWPAVATGMHLLPPPRHANASIYDHGFLRDAWSLHDAPAILVVHDLQNGVFNTFYTGVVEHVHHATPHACGAQLCVWVLDAARSMLLRLRNLPSGYTHVDLNALVSGIAFDSVLGLSPDPTHTFVAVATSAGTVLVDLTSNRTLAVENPASVHKRLIVITNAVFLAQDEGTAAWQLYRLDHAGYIFASKAPVLEALCRRGSFLTGNTCQPCARGAYKDWRGDEACVPCAHENHTTNSIGAVSADQCVCSAGTQPAQGACKACTETQFSVAGGPCQSCPPGAKSDGVRCECPEQEFFDPETEDCQMCPYGSYKPNTGTEYCTGCGAHMYTRDNHQRNASDCLCVPGYGLHPELPELLECAECAPGMFAAGGAHARCQSCAPGTYNEHPRATTCMTCPDGMYTPSAAARACRVCPAGMVAHANQTVCVPSGVQACTYAHDLEHLGAQAFVDTVREDFSRHRLQELTHSPGGIR